MAAPVQAQLYASAAVVTQGDQCCEAAAAIAGQRFLTAETPMLPLEGCTRMDACQCKYQKYSDRRQDDRRGMGNAMGAINGTEQRNMNRSRRNND
jgi:hypothetical protein